MIHIKTTYLCDACEKEVSHDQLEKMRLPCMELDSEGREYFRTFHNLDICEDCKERYVNAVFEHFAKIRVR